MNKQQIKPKTAWAIVLENKIKKCNSHLDIFPTKKSADGILEIKRTISRKDYKIIKVKINEY